MREIAVARDLAVHELCTGQKRPVSDSFHEISACQEKTGAKISNFNVDTSMSRALDRGRSLILVLDEPVATVS